MNVYDFDKTIYPGDSATHFWWFCVRRHPAALASLPGAATILVRSLGKPGIHGALKQQIYGFLRRIPDLEAEVSAFWDGHIQRIYPWYINRRRDDDLVISASPYFLVGEACRRLGIQCMATDMDPATGRIRGENCRREEKVRRYREAYGDAPVEEFYSDSYSDRPMMDLAERAYLMKNGAVAACVKAGPMAPEGEKENESAQ